jgi:hypothetical protein
MLNSFGIKGRFAAVRLVAVWNTRRSACSKSCAYMEAVMNERKTRQEALARLTGPARVPCILSNRLRKTLAARGQRRAGFQTLTSRKQP